MARKAAGPIGVAADPGRRAHGGQDGFTLVEVLVALAIMAVIGGAGFGVLDQVLRVQRQTEVRLERLAGIQRAMLVVELDLRQAANGSVEMVGDDLVFDRPGPAGPLRVRYRLEDAALARYVSGDGTDPARQELMSGVAALAWRFWGPEGGWAAGWPQDSDSDVEAEAEADEPTNPAAVELGLMLAPPGLDGVLRRVALLPAEAEQ